MNNPKLQTDFADQAEMLANRVRKRFRHLHRRFAKQNIDVFRLYDWDIPEIRAVVDWYAGHLVIAEYARKQSVPGWLPIMGNRVAEIMGIPMENLHLKERRAGKQDGKRYERMDYSDKKITVSERDLKFSVNLHDFVDTGLFSDHRNTRQMVREMVRGKDFLNLFCYTGTFTCYAAKGGARQTVSVDRSETNIRWAKENLELNGIPEAGNRLIQKDSFAFLRQAAQQHQTFDIAVVDPPSFSATRSDRIEFDISSDHPDLIRAVLAVMNKGGIVYFSTNHQDFVPEMAHISAEEIKEITDLTIPEDYLSKRKKIHRCWEIRV